MPNETLGLRVAPGFRITLFADEKLANDIYAMTLDAQGRVVVTGPGYIKRLKDTDGDGKADKVTLFGATKGGSQGMCFDGDDLVFYGDEYLSCYRGRDGIASGAPEHLFKSGHGEHGTHAVRKGPDGWWYLIGGNDSRFSKTNITLATSPVREPQCGSIVRFTPDFKRSEIVATGFRNCYDFDFNADGELFTYDSDCERDFFLPWYAPTRLYHVAYGGHHGWRLTGYQRSWPRRPYYMDNVDAVPIGRGSPTGVVVYRHTQFPERFRDGFFALDWTFGKVWFTPLKRRGAGYEMKPEVFLEPIGTQGLAPTDVAVAPDGSMFICIGGRKTRGAVFRIEYVGAKPVPPPATPIASVLQAPQPLDAWSRARWAPVARKLGPQPFRDALADKQLAAADRVRAVEVLTEMFGGLQPADAKAGAKSADPLVRARVAWSLGRVPFASFAPVLLQLAQDKDAFVRRCAIEALTDRAAEVDAAALVRLLPAAFADHDKRVRQGAARLATRLPDTTWKKFSAPHNPQARLTWALANVWRHPEATIHLAVAETAVAVLESTTDDNLRLQALRLIVLALGDWHLYDPSVEVYTAYELPQPVDKSFASRACRSARPALQSRDALVRAETARLLAMLQDDDPEMLAQFIAQITPDSAPTDDLHYLIASSRLRAPFAEKLTATVAAALLNLDSKLEGRQMRVKQTWSSRVSEITSQLLHCVPALAAVLVKSPALASAGHIDLVSSLDKPHRAQAARAFLDAVRRDKNFVWSGALVKLLAEWPTAEVRPLLRAQWDNRGLRDELLAQLAAQPEAADREKFLEGLESPQPLVMGRCIKALAALPRDESAAHLVPVVRVLQRLCSDPAQAALRVQTVALISRQSGREFHVTERGTETVELKRAYQPVMDWFSAQHPNEAKDLAGEGADDPAVWQRLLKSVAWDKGDAVRGAVLFRDRACQTCHAAANALGPDLSGAASRFSVEDLFTAIFDPSRDVAPQFHTEKFVMRDGDSYTGLVVFNSAEGVLVQTSATTTVRLDAADMVLREPSTRSLMPNGLLQGLKPSDLADLYSYLKSLKPRDH